MILCNCFTSIYKLDAFVLSLFLLQPKNPVSLKNETGLPKNKSGIFRHPLMFPMRNAKGNIAKDLRNNVEFNLQQYRLARVVL